MAASAYLDTTLLPDNYHFWVITAVDSSDWRYESLYSNEVSDHPWLAYDDGTAEGFSKVVYGAGAVRFTPDSYPVKLEKVRIYVYGNQVYDYKTYRLREARFNLMVWDDDGEGGAPGTRLIQPILVEPSGGQRWVAIDLSGYDIVVSDGEFYVGWWDLGDGFQIGNDTSDPSVEMRSWFANDKVSWNGYSGFTSMIRVQVLPLSGTSVEETTPQLPVSAFELFQNHPNPFNSGTVIGFQLPTSGEVSLRVYNILGQEIRTLVTGVLKPGTHRVAWDGRDDNGVAVGSGVYLYRLAVDGGRWEETRRMMLLR